METVANTKKSLEQLRTEARSSWRKGIETISKDAEETGYPYVLTVNGDSDRGLTKAVVLSTAIKASLSFPNNTHFVLTEYGPKMLDGGDRLRDTIQKRIEMQIQEKPLTEAMKNEEGANEKGITIIDTEGKMQSFNYFTNTPNNEDVIKAADASKEWAKEKMETSERKKLEKQLQETDGLISKITSFPKPSSSSTETVAPPASPGKEINSSDVAGIASPVAEAGVGIDSSITSKPEAGVSGNLSNLLAGVPPTSDVSQRVTAETRMIDEANSDPRIPQALKDAVNSGYGGAGARPSDFNSPQSVTKPF